MKKALLLAFFAANIFSQDKPAKPLSEQDKQQLKILDKQFADCEKARQELKRAGVFNEAMLALTDEVVNTGKVGDNVGAEAIVIKVLQKYAETLLIRAKARCQAK